MGTKLLSMVPTALDVLKWTAFVGSNAKPSVRGVPLGATLTVHPTGSTLRAFDSNPSLNTLFVNKFPVLSAQYPPSSHCSPLATTPSPQLSDIHCALQPSPLCAMQYSPVAHGVLSVHTAPTAPVTRFTQFPPLSHCSRISMTPFPQKAPLPSSGPTTAPCKHSASKIIKLFSSCVGPQTYSRSPSDLLTSVGYVLSS